MKLLPILLLLAGISLGITSCNLLGENEDASSMTANIDGESWESTSLATTFTKVDSSLLTITGNTASLSASSIIIQIISYAGEGTYDLSAGQSAGFANYLPNVTVQEAYSSLANNSTGTITITTDNDEFAEGTFSFSAAFERDDVFETIEITDGVFKINKL